MFVKANTEITIRVTLNQAESIHRLCKERDNLFLDHGKTEGVAIDSDIHETLLKLDLKLAEVL